ncbi:hypothetical protein [Vibrio sonorensis]|uniref:hypothetical protein n=1 Tax=Vibrio sonorensis TaxID=1004316 RepID=UPI0008DB2348|nr:hypothetical protein [Vibrio sonorensis]
MKIDDVPIQGEILEHTGKVIMSDLEDVDLAVGHQILSAINTLAIHAPHIGSGHPRYKTTKTIKDFLNRAPEDQLAYGVFDSPKSFLKELAKDAGEQDKKEKLLAKLPMLYLSRDQSISFSDTDADKVNVHQLKDGTGKVMGDVDAYYPVLNYSLTIVSWHKESMSMLASHLLTYFRERMRKGKRTFKSELYLAGVKLVFDWSFQDGLTYMGSNISEPFSEDRLNAMTIDVIVKATAYKLRIAKAFQARLIGRPAHEQTK